MYYPVMYWPCCPDMSREDNTRIGQLSISGGLPTIIIHFLPGSILHPEESKIVEKATSI